MRVHTQGSGKLTEKPQTPPKTQYDPLEPDEPVPGIPLPPDSSPQPPAPITEPGQPEPIKDPTPTGPTRLSGEN
jgi:hypothetical protein